MARVRPPAFPVVKSRLFAPVFAALTVLAAAPFWRTGLLPMQDYPQILVFARVYGDCRDPSSPFFGTYTTGFPLSPLLLPILTLRAIGAVSSLETAGRVMWTLYAVGLPLASLHLLRALGRDCWCALLVFPLVFSYWSGGGFFAFATSAPLLVLGLSLGVRWLEAPTGRRGAAFAAVLCALHLWHSMAFAQILLDFGVLWLLHRAEDGRARLRAWLPAVPSLALFALWTLATLKGRPPGSRPPSWPPFFDNAGHFFDFIGPVFPEATAVAVILAVILLGERSPAGAAGPGSGRSASTTPSAGWPCWRWSRTWCSPPPASGSRASTTASRGSPRCCWSSAGACRRGPLREPRCSRSSGAREPWCSS